MGLVKKIISAYLSKFPLLVNGRLLYLNASDTGLAYQLLFRKYEPFVMRIMKNEINEGDVVCDVGAHVGTFSLLMSSLVGKGGRVYAFEPDVDNFLLLRKNIKVNKISNIEMINKAVSDKKGKLTLYKHKDDSTDHRIFNEKGDDLHLKTQKVGVDTLESLVGRDAACVVFVKIDVQGVEEKVIMGMKKILKNHNIKIVMELWPYGQKRAGFDPAKILKYLEKRGFKIYWINEEKNKLMRIKNYEQMVKKAEDFHFYNLLCKK